MHNEKKLFESFEATRHLPEALENSVSDKSNELHKSRPIPFCRQNDIHGPKTLLQIPSQFRESQDFHESFGKEKPILDFHNSKIFTKMGKRNHEAFNGDEPQEIHTPISGQVTPPNNLKKQLTINNEANKNNKIFDINSDKYYMMQKKSNGQQIDEPQRDSGNLLMQKSKSQIIVLLTCREKLESCNVCSNRQLQCSK